MSRSESKSREITIRVSTDGHNRIETDVVPIIVLPGLMASRLYFPRSGKTWDPDDYTSTVWQWVFAKPEEFRKAMDIRQRAKVMEEGEFDSDRLRRGWGGPAKHWYGDFLEAMEAKTFGAIQTPVYAIGYDWRRSNNHSGRSVAIRVHQTLKECGASRFVLITHSMGGVVARAMLKNESNLSAAALGVIHVAQPALGAVGAYRRMFTGTPISWDGALMRFLLGNSGADFQTILAGLRAPFELLPFSEYCFEGEEDWLRFRRFERPEKIESWFGNIWKLYRSTESPPGILASDQNQSHYIDPKLHDDIREALREAEAFQRELGTWKHKNTWSIAGKGHLTDVKLQFHYPPKESRSISIPTPNGRPQREVVGCRDDGTEAIVPLYLRDTPFPQVERTESKSDNGDATVPFESAMGLEGGPIYSADLLRANNVTSLRKLEVKSDLAHDYICSDPALQNAITKIIEHIIGGEK